MQLALVSLLLLAIPAEGVRKRATTEQEVTSEDFQAASSNESATYSCCRNGCCQHERGWDRDQKIRYCQSQYPNECRADPGCCNQDCCRYDNSFQRAQKEQWCTQNGPLQCKGDPGCCHQQCCRNDRNHDSAGKQAWCRAAGPSMCRNNGFPGGSPHNGFPGGLPNNGFPGSSNNEVCCMCQQEQQGSWGRQRTLWLGVGDYRVGNGDANFRCNRYCPDKCRRKGYRMAGCYNEARLKQFQQEALRRDDWQIEGRPNDRWDNPWDIC